jgi:hypothetical protein
MSDLATRVDGIEAHMAAEAAETEAAVEGGMLGKALQLYPEAKELSQAILKAEAEGDTQLAWRLKARWNAAPVGKFSTDDPYHSNQKTTFPWEDSLRMRIGIRPDADFYGNRAIVVQRLAEQIDRGQLELGPDDPWAEEIAAARQRGEIGPVKPRPPAPTIPQEPPQ